MMDELQNGFPVKDYTVIDIETSGLELDAKLWCIGMIIKKKLIQITWTDIAGKNATPDRCDWEYVKWEMVSTAINYVKGKVACHHAAFDIGYLANINPDVLNWDIDDTMLMSYTLKPSSSNNHSLGALAPLVGMQKIEHDDFEHYDANLKARNQSDLIMTDMLYQHFSHALAEKPDVQRYYEKVERPYLKICMQMSQGVHIDTVYRDKLIELMNSQCKLLEVEVAKMAGFTQGKTYENKSQLKRLYGNAYTNITLPDENGVVLSTPYSRLEDGSIIYPYSTLVPVNPNSTDQVAAVLMKQGWVPTKYTATGKPQLTKDILMELEYPLAKAIRKLDQAGKIKNDYLMKLSPLTKPRVNQCMTRTTRLSFSEPPLQQIPANGIGQMIRKCFIARPGYKLIVGDVDQFELRILAFLLELYLGDTSISAPARAGVNLHTANAQTWGIPRKDAKVFIFSMVYGSGAASLAAKSGKSVKEAREIMAAINGATQLEELRKILISECQNNRGFIKGWLGGEFFIPEIFYRDEESVAAGKRRIFNYKIQGTQAQLMKYLMLAADKNLSKFISDWKWLLSIHDEPICEVPEAEAEEARGLIEAKFNSNKLLSSGDIYVPITAKFVVCDNWLQGKAERYAMWCDAIETAYDNRHELLTITEGDVISIHTENKVYYCT